MCSLLVHKHFIGNVKIKTGIPLNLQYKKSATNKRITLFLQHHIQCNSHWLSNHTIVVMFMR